VNKALDLAEIVPVERMNRDSAISSIRRAGEVMKHHINMTIFPEGTRSPDGRLMPFKKGPFHLAAETGFPIVPITILGTYEMMPRETPSLKEGRRHWYFTRLSTRSNSVHGKSWCRRYGMPSTARCRPREEDRVLKRFNCRRGPRQSLSALPE